MPQTARIYPGPGPIRSIQYLRAFAAMLVVLHHARNPQPWLYNPMQNIALGTRGVDIFFIISGFIMYTAARNETVPIFIFRRFARVVPLYWLATLIFILIGLALGRGFSRINILRSLLFIPFHNPSHENQIWPILVPGWTLVYEMFFYALFAISLSTRRLLVTLTAVIVFCVSIGLIFTSNNAIFLTYTSPLLLEFLFGVLVGVVNCRWNLSVLWPLLPIGIIALPMGDYTHLPGITAGIVPGAMIVLGALGLEARCEVPCYRVGLMLGEASYSIYLFHTILMMGSNKAVEVVPFRGWPQFITMSVFTLLISAAGGLIVYRYVERPITKIMSRMLGRRLISAGPQAH